MKLLTAGAIRGNWGTLLLAWNGDESLDLARVGVEIDALIRAGVDGIYSSGTAGEFHTQTEEEFDRVSGLLAQVGGWADVGWRMRWPYRSIPAEEAERLRPIVRELLPEFA